MANGQCRIVAARGPERTVSLALTANRKCPSHEFLEELSVVRTHNGASDVRNEFYALFQAMANFGEQGIPRGKFKSEPGKLFAFSLELNNVQYRFPCFKDRSEWIITHGFIKPGAKRGKGKWPRPEIERANRIMGEYRTCIEGARG